jgi:hypothetical protein
VKEGDKMYDDAVEKENASDRRPEKPEKVVEEVKEVKTPPPVVVATPPPKSTNMFKMTPKLGALARLRAMEVDDCMPVRKHKIDKS